LFDSKPKISTLWVHKNLHIKEYVVSIALFLKERFRLNLGSKF